MKKLNVWVVLGIATCTSAMIGLHWQGMRVVQQKISQLDALAERETVAGSLQISMERYRRQSGRFRLLSPAEHTAVKNKLATDISEAVSKLEKLNPTSDERALGTQAVEQVSEFMVLTAKLEPWLFTKDVFQKPEAQQLYEALGTTVAQLRKSAVTRSGSLRVEAAGSQSTAMNLLIAAGAIILCLVGILIARNYMSFVRPLRMLQVRAGELKEGKLESEIILKGVHSQVEAVMSGLAQVVDKQNKERAQFITAVASDLRAPLVSLQAGAHLLASVGERLDESHRLQASQSVRRSVFRLSRSLDDLTDIVDLERTDIRLEEKIVDLRDLLHGVAKMMGGPGVQHEVTSSAPGVPIWTLIDPQRFERVMVNLVSKMMQYMPQGGRIDLSMVRPTEGKFRGVEILIQDGERIQSARGIASGPEQDLLRHWVSENGFGMALAQKIVKAHGGTITASGVVGSSVLFTIRIPQERVASGLIASQSVASAQPQPPVRSAEVAAYGEVAARQHSGQPTPQQQRAALELSRIKSVVAEKAVSFGS